MLRNEKWCIDSRINVLAIIEQHEALEPIAGEVFDPAPKYAAGKDLYDGGFSVTVDGGVAIVGFKGVMINRVPDIYRKYGLTDFVDLSVATSVFKSLGEDPSVTAIQVYADTPGGTVAGTDELATVISGIEKQVSVHVTGMLASAGVWAFAHADVISATRTAEGGSIGVYTVLYDYSKTAENEGWKAILISSGGVKGQGAFGTEIGDGKIAAEQEIIDDLNKMFQQQVALGRGLTEEQVSAINTGQIWIAEKAVALGIFDVVSNEPQVLSPAQINMRREEANMNLAKLIQDNLAHAGLVAQLAQEGKDEDQILAAIKDAEIATAQAAAQAKIDEQAAEIDALKSAIIEKEDASARDAAKIAELEAKIEGMGGIVAQAENDPGETAPVENAKITRADICRGNITAEQAAAIVRGELNVNY